MPLGNALKAKEKSFLVLKQNTLNKEDSLNYGASKCGSHALASLSHSPALASLSHSPALASISHSPALAPPTHFHTCSLPAGNAPKN